MTHQPEQDPVEDSGRQRLTAPELSWAVRALVRAAQEVDQELARRLELRPLDSSALNHVMSGSVPLGSAELSGRLGISTGSATELVDRLEEAGHLHRRPHPSDRRRKVLEPTDAAVARTLGTLQPLFERLDALVEQFSPEEQAVIGRYLRAVTAHFHDFAAPPPLRTIPSPSHRRTPHHDRLHRPFPPSVASLGATDGGVVLTAGLDRKAAWALSPRLLWLACASYVATATAARNRDEFLGRTRRR